MTEGSRRSGGAGAAAQWRTKPGEDRRWIRPSRPRDAPAFTWFLTVGLPPAADSADPISLPRFFPLSFSTRADRRSVTSVMTVCRQSFCVEGPC